MEGTAVWVRLFVARHAPPEWKIWAFARTTTPKCASSFYFHFTRLDRYVNDNTWLIEMCTYVSHFTALHWCTVIVLAMCPPVRIFACFFPALRVYECSFFKDCSSRSSESFLEEILKSLHIFNAWSPWYVVDYVANDFSYSVLIISPSVDCWCTHQTHILSFAFAFVAVRRPCTQNSFIRSFIELHCVCECMCRSAHSHAPHYQLKFLSNGSIHDCF